MLRFFSIISVLLGFTYSTLSCAEELNTQKLEAVLNSTFTEVIENNLIYELTAIDENTGEEETVSEIKIDHEFSNFDLGRILIDLKAQTIPLESNNNEKLKLKAQLKTDISDTEDARKHLSVQSNIDINIQTLPALKFVSNIFGECEQTPIDDETPNSVHIQNIMCFIQTSISEAIEISDLQSGFQEAADYAKLVYGENDTVNGGLIADLFASMTLSVDEAGNLIMSVAVDSVLGGGLVNAPQTDNEKNIAGTLTITIKPDGIFVNISGGVTFDSSKLNEYVDTVKDYATELQDRNSKVHTEYYENYLYNIMGLIEGFLYIEDEEDDF